jgi:hypothetical protein
VIGDYLLRLWLSVKILTANSSFFKLRKNVPQCEISRKPAAWKMVKTG